MTFLLVLFLFVAVEAMGLLFLFSLLGKSAPLDRAGTFGLAWGAGWGLLSFSLFYLACFRITLNPQHLWILSIGLVLCGLLRPLCQFRQFQFFLRYHFCPGTVTRNTLERSLLLGLIGLILLLLLAEALRFPLTTFDARAIWAMKARVLADQQTIFIEDFFNPARLHAHQRYPLLIPLAQQFLWQLTGSREEWVIRLLFPFFFAALLLLFHSLAKNLSDGKNALRFTAALASLPAYTIFANGGVSSGYADIPLSYYVLATAFGIWTCVFKKNENGIPLFLFFGAFAAFTKNEGWALVGLLPMVALGIVVFSKRFELRSFLLLLWTGAILLLLLSPWLWYIQKLPNIDEDYFSRLNLPMVQQGLERTPLVAKAYFRELFGKPHLWNVLGFWLMASLLVHKNRLRQNFSSFFLIFPLLYLLFLGLIFLISPWDLTVLIPISLTRLWLQVTPLAFLWLATQFTAEPLGAASHSHIKNSEETTQH